MPEFDVFRTTGRALGRVNVGNSATVRDLKNEVATRLGIAAARQSIRCGPTARNEEDTVAVGSLALEHPGRVYIKDLGLQIGWDTVFFYEYAGPIFLYLLFLMVPHCFYSEYSITRQDPKDNAHRGFDMFPFAQVNYFCNPRVNYKVHDTAFYAAILWSVHYVKRILETAFVHRFSHGTMPVFNLFKNCSYYWGFTIFIAYHINHPLHSAPRPLFFYLGLFLFIISELGNLSVHILLRNLRPEGTNVRKIPVPNANPLTQLFHYVSCPNYTYEFGAWLGFTFLTGCLPAFIFAIAGLYQMTIWAVTKHKKYQREFPNYPKQRKAIIPFML